MSDCLVLSYKEAEVVYSAVAFKFIAVREEDKKYVKPLLEKIEHYLKSYKKDAVNDTSPL